VTRRRAAALRAAFAALLCFVAFSFAARAADMTFIDAEIAAHPGHSGVYVLESAEEALLARAWLARNAAKSIDVQYFIWSTDNIGILAAEALLAAADRGVRVRVLVDDLLIDAPDKSLLALAKHPLIDIRIYNPRTSVGVPLQTRLLNVVTDFRGVNQRMHDKIVLVDGKVAITGGRNMAAEYFDYHHGFNFRDRDVLLLGDGARVAQASFERFWSSPLAAQVEQLYDGLGLMQKNVGVDDAEVQKIYRGLREYARAPENFAPEVRAAIEATPASFGRIARQTAWTEVEFISDQPGKNDNRFALDGGGATAIKLATLVEAAREKIVIQSPYLVLSDRALELFEQALARGVRVAISTNSMAATDNLPAFSGYRNQRDRLLRMGIGIHEYRPDPRSRQGAIQRGVAATGKATVMSLHAKSMVVDSRIAYVGTFNLDPRSENLNTEVGVVIHDAAVARAVEEAIEQDMGPGESWNAATDDPDRHAPLAKRAKVRALQLLPLRPLL
jgi:putative cardiolipin synthase